MKFTLWLRTVKGKPSFASMRVDAKEEPFDTPRILNLGREIYARLKETCDICNGNEIKKMAGSERARAAMERQGMA